MKTWPIIFSAPMVKALLAKRKTMTRRIPTSQWANVAMCHEVGQECWLWARETFTTYSEHGGINSPDDRVLYAVDFEGFERPDRDWAWSPSIHMPRWASRISLKVEEIGLELLQDISEDGAKAEGVTIDALSDRSRARFERMKTWPELYRPMFSLLWSDLHPGKTWKDNPEVYAFRFAVHCRNIDMIGEMPNG